MVHPTWELPVEAASLVLMPCPGTKELGLAESIQQLQQSGVKAIVTALTTEEMQSKNVGELGQLVQDLGMVWIHLPIEDDSVPDDVFAEHWSAVSPQLQEMLKKGEKVALHCMGGSGRTGLLAGHLLLDMNWDLETIISQVQALRPGAFTKPEQCEYIKQVSAAIS